MPFTASAGQQAALPIRSGGDTTVASSLLINGASFSAPVVSNVDETLVVIRPTGTIQADSTAILLVSTNGTNFGVLRTFTNAEIANQNGVAVLARIGIGNTYRVQFIAGSTTGAGNGITVWTKN